MVCLCVRVCRRFYLGTCTNFEVVDWLPSDVGVLLPEVLEIH